MSCRGAAVVQGRGMDGREYRGTATLQPAGTNTWRITWRIGDDGAEGLGLLIPEGPLLVVGYVIGRETGVAAYAVQADGSLHGTWTQGQGGGTGAEILTPAGGGGVPRK